MRKRDSEATRLLLYYREQRERVANMSGTVHISVLPKREREDYHHTARKRRKIQSWRVSIHNNNVLLRREREREV